MSTRSRLRFSIVASLLVAGAGCPADDAMQGETEGTDASSGDGSSAGPTSITSTSATTMPGDDATSAGSTGDDGLETSASSAVDSTGAGSSGDVAGCGAVDVLLVLDTSGSMLEKQSKLHDAVYEHVTTLPDLLGTDDMHVLVTDIDAWSLETCATQCTMAQNGGCIVDGMCDAAAGGTCNFDCLVLGVCGTDADPPYECGTTEPGVCEDVLGAGIVHPQGEGSANTDCGLRDQRWLPLSDPDFASKLSCISHVGAGSWSNVESPAAATLAALSPRGEAEACNHGFRREDAALVVVFATDEDDLHPDGSPGEPAEWAADLLALAGDRPLVVGGLFGDTGNAGSPCVPLDAGGPYAADFGARLLQWTLALGDAAVTGSICADDYAPFFADVAERAVQACAAR